MTHPEIRAVIFDCDGTLVDSEPISLRVLVEMLDDWGLSVAHEEAMQRWAGCDLHEIFREAESRADRKLPGDFMDTFRVEQLKRLREELQPIDGAAELLRTITMRHCVASNAPRVKVRCCLEATELIDFFDADLVLSAYDVNAWKPLPDVFLHAAKQMSVEPKHCAVVEDSQFGIDAGVAAGMHVFALDPQRKYLGLGSEGNISSIQRLSELIPILGAG